MVLIGSFSMVYSTIKENLYLWASEKSLITETEESNIKGRIIAAVS